MTAEDWPEEITAARAELVERPGFYLGKSASRREEHLIAISRAIPAHSEELFQIVSTPIVTRVEEGGEGRVYIDQRRRGEAAAKLAELIGMLEHTSYIDSDLVEWRPIIIFAARFIYYHELGHLTRWCLEDPCAALDLLPAEAYLAEEIRADFVAFSLLAMELRNQEPDLLFVGFSGVSLAMCLMGAQEYATPGRGRRTQSAEFRMGRLQYWTRLASARQKTPFPGRFVARPGLFCGAVEGLWRL